MKLLLLLVYLLVASASVLSPVTRVVELLKGISEKIEAEGKAEQDLYDSYICWGKTLIEKKTASNAAAASRIDTLETYIADLDSGKIELTSERTDREKEVADLSAEVEEAKAMRDKDKAEFQDAKAEMEEGIAALDSAMDVLDKATKDHKEGVLMAIHSRLSHGVEALEQEQRNLKHAVALGEKFLDQADATFLRRLLTGDVPKADWKKLNRKAAFKMGYKARSFKIQDVLKNMRNTFQANLDDAEKNEEEANALYGKLSEKKKEQLAASEEALSKGELEGGAKGKAKADAQEEVDSLRDQIAADEQAISDTEAALDTKKQEWTARSELRSGELTAVSKAISILYNDDARDLFKKSGSSQEGLFFLQVSRQSSNAANAIRSAARRSGDTRLLALATLAAETDKDFAPIIESIDKMIAVLKSEAEDDEKSKEDCEEGRRADTASARDAGLAIDDMTDAMTKLESEIKEITDDVASLEAERADVQKELGEAEEFREKEHLKWQTDDQEDGEAAEVVLQAREVLANFYSDNNLAFVQTAAASAVHASAAQPKSPATWEGDYGGKTTESQGILAVLDMIHEDIGKDKQKAQADEDDAQARFNKFSEDSEEEITALTERISQQNGLKGEKETEHGTIKDERRSKKGSLNAVMEKMEAINENCEFFTANYDLRASNRVVESDGLVKAKAILQGGAFEKALDPDREIKPGDSFLQRRTK